MIINQSAGPLFETVSVFFLVKQIFLREYNAGMYSSLTYYLCTFIVTGLLQPLYTLIFCGIIYPMVGLRPGAQYFFMLYLALLLCKYCALSLAFLIGTTFSKIQYSQIISPIILYILILFGGLYINLNNINDVLKSIQYIDFVRYAYQILVNNEFVGQTYQCIASNCPVSGQQIVDELGLGVKTLAIPIIAIISITIILSICAAIMIKIRIPKFKQLKPIQNNSDKDLSVKESPSEKYLDIEESSKEEQRINV
ncbi:hypothetical protein MHBO_001498 [Bonamia ostreae]|uniref:ABC-2 type transporter transmembrane domain-containing protein n=1 Tax=Bonamia ostreae TaxID=126728 RepID=A0ABV2AJ51_9EUKA